MNLGSLLKLNVTLNDKQNFFLNEYEQAFHKQFLKTKLKSIYNDFLRNLKAY